MQNTEKKKENNKNSEKKEEKPKPPKVCQTFKVLKKFSYPKEGETKITLREFVEIKSEGAFVIEGFPSKGLTNALTANYIAEQLKLPLIGDIICPQFPPLGVVKNGQPANGARIYGNDKIICFCSDFQIQSPAIAHAIVEAIYDFVKRNKCGIIITSEAISGDPNEENEEDFELVFEGDDEEEFDMSDILNTKKLPETKEDFLKLMEEAKKKQEEYEGKLWFVTNSESFADKLIELKHEPINEFTLTGVAGGILSNMITTPEVPVAVLISPLHELLRVGARAAIAIIQCLDDLMGKVIDISKLDETAEKLEAKIHDLISKTTISERSKASHMYM